MKLLSKITASIGLTLALATVSFAQQVKTDYDHNVNFGQYKTYSWEKVRTKDPLLVDRIKTAVNRSEEHTSELQSLTKLVCRLLLEKKNKWPQSSGTTP